MSYLYIGIDWSEKHHDVCILNSQGQPIGTITVAHSLEGFRQLDAFRQKLAVARQACLVGLETAHTLLIDFLWEQGYSEVYVIPPRMVSASRPRYRPSAARDDPSDAYVIADLLRTDRHRLEPWQPGSPLLQQMRVQVKLVYALTKEIVATSNRLRAVLLRYYPAILSLFQSWPTKGALRVLQAYPTPAAAAQVSLQEFRTFAQQNRLSTRHGYLTLYERLQAPQPTPAPGIAEAYQNQALLWARFLLAFMDAKAKALDRLNQLFHDHPDAPIFASLPGAGSWLAPALLVKCGEDRQRFPTAQRLQAVAGTAPITVKSGKFRSVQFRRGCDHHFRNIACQWARSLVAHSAWARAYFEQARPRHRSDQHTYRCLANRALAILWRLWQTRATYDEERHLQNRAQRLKPKP